MSRSKARPNRWEDHYSRRARKEKYPARSVYKLQEIQKKYNLINTRDKVLDLGCYPGSWLLFAATLTGPRGQVVGIDLRPITIKLPAHVRGYTTDVFSLNDDFLAAEGRDFNVVISDMAPETSGNKFVDNTRSFNLSCAALSIAQRLLVPGGSFACKIFQGEDFKVFADSVKAGFKLCKTYKPQSSRKASREIFVIGLGKK